MYSQKVPYPRNKCRYTSVNKLKWETSPLLQVLSKYCFRKRKKKRDKLRFFVCLCPINLTVGSKHAGLESSERVNAAKVGQKITWDLFPPHVEQEPALLPISLANFGGVGVFS